MRVALAQARLDPTSRSANIQGLIAIVRDAAGMRPAPDLIVLPGSCDTGGAVAGPDRFGAGMRGVREALSFEARYWGVYLAVGLHRRIGDDWVPASVLFDPDGDVVAWAHRRPTSDEAGAGEALAFWHTAVGRIGVCEAAMVSAWDDLESVLMGGEFIAIPSTSTLPGDDGGGTDGGVAWLRSDARFDLRAHWGVVVPAGSGRREMSAVRRSTCVIAPDGTVWCEAQSAERTVLHVDVELPVARAEPIDTSPAGGGE